MLTKFGELWSTNGEKQYRCSDPLKIKFFGCSGYFRFGFRLLKWCDLQPERNHENLYFCVLKDELAFIKDVTKYLQPLRLFIVYLH